MKNYRPVNESRSQFKPRDSCINQLLSITHKISKSFSDGFDVRGVFLDISKAFDKVWQKGIIFKLKQNCIFGKLLSVLSDFLKDRKQRVTLNGQISSWVGINEGVPQGSPLGLSFFGISQRFSCWDLIKCKIFCRWCIFIVRNPRLWHFCK